MRWHCASLSTPPRQLTRPHRHVTTLCVPSRPARTPPASEPTYERRPLPTPPAACTRSNMVRVTRPQTAPTGSAHPLTSTLLNPGRLDCTCSAFSEKYVPRTLASPHEMHAAGSARTHAAAIATSRALCTHNEATSTPADLPLVNCCRRVAGSLTSSLCARRAHSAMRRASARAADVRDCPVVALNERNHLAQATPLRRRSTTHRG